MIAETSNLGEVVQALVESAAVVVRGVELGDLLASLDEIARRYEHPDSDRDGITTIRPDLRSGEPGGGFTTTALQLHSDRAFVDDPPHLLMSYMNNMDRVRGGESVLCNMQEVVDCLDNHERLALLELELVDLRTRATYPVIFRTNGSTRLRIRWREDSICGVKGDRQLVATLRELMNEHKRTYELNSGDAYVVVNDYYLHGRTQILDPTRELLRVLYQPKPGIELCAIKGIPVD